MISTLLLDSCCDLNEEWAQVLAPARAPLKVRVGEREWVDDGTVDIPSLIDAMAASRQAARSTCPSVEEYAQAMRREGDCFAVTLSGKLSGSYNAACVAADMVRAEQPGKRIHVFDSLSASAGETQVALFIHERLAEGLEFDAIVAQTEAYIGSMNTLFVLEDLGNLIKNGRVSKVAGIVASVLSLCPIMGDNGEGEIRLVAKVRGMQNALQRLVSTVAEMTAGCASQSKRLVLAYCNCRQRAEALRQQLLTSCRALHEVILVPTGALSTMYANSGGIIVAF